MSNKCYKLNIEISNAIDSLEEFTFHIKFKNNTTFNLGKCYYTLKKNTDYNFHISDLLELTYVCTDQEQSIDSLHTIRKSVYLLIYLTNIPFKVPTKLPPLSHILEIPVCSNYKNVRKITNIEQRLSNFTPLFSSSLALYGSATILNYFDNSICEAYFNFFKIIESLAKTKQITNYNSNFLDTKMYKVLNDIIISEYKASTTLINNNELISTAISYVLPQFFSSANASISHLCNLYKVNIDAEILAKAIRLRNKYAHGSIIDIHSSSPEYLLISSLSRTIISLYFFNTKNISIPSSQKIL